jgi:hypothetical protein
VFNFLMDRPMHRHGDEWVEMEPVGSPHSPDDRDPERQMIRGEQIFRCIECDEEIRIVPKGSPG